MGPVKWSFDVSFFSWHKQTAEQSIDLPVNGLPWHPRNFTLIICYLVFWCWSMFNYIPLSLRWRRNGRDGVSNHQPHDCLLNRLFSHRSKKTSKLRVTGLCAGNSSGTGEFPTQRASYAENVSIWWRHHVYPHCTREAYRNDINKRFICTHWELDYIQNKANQDTLLHIIYAIWSTLLQSIWWGFWKMLTTGHGRP